MKVHRTVRYRLHPGSARKNRQLHGTAGACRFVWNHMVGFLWAVACEVNGRPYAMRAVN